MILTASFQGAGESCTPTGETPLFFAVVYGHVRNATFLLQNGCNPDIQNEDGDSPLVAGV